MIRADRLLKLLNQNSINFFSGVPDSCLKNFTNKLEKFDKKKHVIAVNEGSAVSIGIGYYLSQKKVPCIYMQNSGLSNALNPIISIAHQRVYEIPLCLLIGWRGAPKEIDEPQHMLKGEITKKLLKILNIKFFEIKSEKQFPKIKKILVECIKKKKIVALLIRNGKLIDKSKKINRKPNPNKLNKENFYQTLLSLTGKNSSIVSSTGYTSREIMYIRKKYNFINGRDFYMVGGMGHTASVASAYSINKKKNTICLDGDGSLLMHLGSIKTAADISNSNFKYILLNNNCHESVGSQTTNANNVNFKALSIGIGFKNYSMIKNNHTLKKELKNFLVKKGPSFLEVKVGVSINDKLPRPKNLKIIKANFIK